MVWVIWLSLQPAKEQARPIRLENFQIGPSLLKWIGRPIRIRIWKLRRSLLSFTIYYIRGGTKQREIVHDWWSNPSKLKLDLYESQGYRRSWLRGPNARLPLERQQSQPCNSLSTASHWTPLITTVRHQRWITSVPFDYEDAHACGKAWGLWPRAEWLTPSKVKKTAPGRVWVYLMHIMVHRRRGRVGSCPPPQKKESEKIFWGKSQLEFKNFVNFTGFCHVKFGHFVNNGKYHVKFRHFVIFHTYIF